jgi:acetamidase/formamidase
VTTHEIPLEQRTVHGWFSRDYEPVLSVDSGDSIELQSLNAGWRWNIEERWDVPEGAGHALTGPILVRGAQAGGTLAVHFDELRVATWGATFAGGWPSPLNDFLGVSEGEQHILRWSLDAEADVGRDQHGREVDLRPFLGVAGMPPPDSGEHPTGPPRRFGGNIDCGELVEGTTLYLPIPVDGALFSAGDGHARQGDGEVSQTAIECPMERVRLSLSLADVELENPIARIADAWLAFGFDEDLDAAAHQAIDGMLRLMGREHGLERRDALALASVVVDLRVTQVVNGVKGVHALLRDRAIR